MASLTVKEVKTAVDFNKVYLDLHNLLKEAGKGKGVELVAVRQHYNISQNKLDTFKKGLSSWHLDLVRQQGEGRGSGKLMVIYSPPEKEEKKGEKEVKQEA